jgi:phosphatidylethanolamine-binding protein (PEBP) family uncharacterized protein
MSLLANLVAPIGWLLRDRRPDERLSVRHSPQLGDGRSIDLQSPAFPDGGTIPDRHCSMDLGPNVSPGLGWTGIPEGTAQLLFVIEDIDAPRSRPSLHTIALLPPGLTGLEEGELTTDNPAIRFVPATRGRLGYLGLRPLPGHGVHRYGFHLYALAEAIPSDRELTGLPDVLVAAQGHVLASGLLEGTKKG